MNEADNPKTSKKQEAKQYKIYKHALYICKIEQNKHILLFDELKKSVENCLWWVHVTGYKFNIPEVYKLVQGL